MTDPAISEVNCRIPYFARSQTNKGEAEKFVIVKGSIGAGLGDKIRALSVGLLLAKVTGRTLWVDWDDQTYGQNVGNLFPVLFSVSGLSTVKSCPNVLSAKPEIWSGKLGTPQAKLRADDLHARGVIWAGAAPPWDPQDAMRRYSWDAADLHDQVDAVVVTTMLSAKLVLAALRREGIIRNSARDSLVLEQCLRDHLRVSSAIGSQVAEFIEKQKWDGRFVIGVHVRHSTESSAARTMPVLSEYFAAVDRAQSGRSNARIFLATDNEDVVGLFCERYSDERVMVTNKWFASPGQSLHKNPRCPDGVASAKEAIVDMALLSSADFLISVGNSSFSLVANAFSIAPENQRLVLFPHEPLWRRMLRPVIKSVRRDVD